MPLVICSGFKIREGTISWNRNVLIGNAVFHIVGICPVLNGNGGTDLHQAGPFLKIEYMIGLKDSIVFYMDGYLEASHRI